VGAGECTEWRTRTGTCEGIGVGMSACEGERVRVQVGLDNAMGFEKRGGGLTALVELAWLKRAQIRPIGSTLNRRPCPDLDICFCDRAPRPLCVIASILR
jgi:hypothetical protein